MEIDDALEGYLGGRDFSRGLSVSIVSPRDTVRDRNDLLAELVDGKRVVHVGCVDHVPLLEEKITTGTWLHERLAQRARRCIGVDTNVEGIELLRQRFGRTDVVAGDITRDDVPDVDEAEWDAFVLADVLEHVDSPVAFLAALKERHASRVSDVVVTVPNALCARNRRSAPRGRELINTDHRYWFTPYTLAKVAYVAGVRPMSISYADFVPRTTLGRLRYRFRRRAPALAETLVLRASLRPA